MDFDEWYEENYPTVLAAVAVICGASLRSVEDPTMDAFVTAYERWERVSNMSSPSGWVVRVATNTRRRSIRRALRGNELAFADAVLLAASDSYQDTDLLQALGKLSYRQRRAVVLHHFEGLTQAEVAADLGVAPGTAAATLSQARSKLRNELENPTEAST